MCYEPEGTYEVYNAKVVKARKPHRCTACHEEIPKGTHYMRVKGIYEHEIDQFKRCHRCEVIFQHLAAKCRREGIWPDGNLDCGTSYQDAWGGEPPEEIAAMAFWRPE